MTELEYDNMLKECYSIPILEVGALVVPDFEIYRGNATGKCCKHVDNKKGNFSFETKKNFAKCFTCQQSFTTINLVKEFNGLKFKDAILFLYQNFPSYFTKEPFSGEYKYVKDDWNGLTNNEYSYLKLPTRIPLNGGKMQIREFARLYPFEHDVLLINTIMLHKKLIEDVYNSFISTSNELDINISKVKQDRKDMYYKLLFLLEKGVMNKNLLKKVNGKLDLERTLIILNNKQKKIS